MTFELVLVEWLDAVSADAWESIEKAAPEPALCLSAGFLLTIDEQKVTLALNHDTQNDNVSCIMTIPRGMVKSILPLKVLKTKGINNAKSSQYRVSRGRNPKRN